MHLPRIQRSSSALLRAALLAALVLIACRPDPASPANSAVDLNGTAVDPLTSPDRVVVLIFVAVECPISNRLMPQMQRLHDTFTAKSVSFWLVYPDPASTADEIRRHLTEYRCNVPALRDVLHALVKKSSAHVTPESVVFDQQRQIAYRGRINDQFVDFGKSRHEPTQHDLENALQALLENKPVSNAVTRAVGCYISPLR